MLEFDGCEQFLPSKYPIMFSDIEVGCFQLLLNEFQNNFEDRLFTMCSRVVGLAVISGVLKVMTLTSGFPVKTQSVAQFLLLNRRNQ